MWESKRRFGGQSDVKVMNILTEVKKLEKNKEGAVYGIVHKYCCDKLDKIKKLDNF